MLPMGSTTDAILRSCLLGLFAVGATGAGGDLLLIGHTEGIRQWVPLVLLGCGIASAVWCAVGRQPVALRIFQITMVALLLGGTVGLWLHYRGNLEFAREASPGRNGMDLFVTAIQGASPPTLAPATLIHLGLIGLAYTYRHPAVALRSERGHGPSGDTP
jgi:hypothetical protein